MIRYETPFTEQDIVGIKPLAAGHPVWALEGYQESMVAIKAECITATSQTNMATTLSIMNVVSPNAKAKPLLSQEFSAVRNWVAKAKQQASGEMEKQFLMELSDIEQHIHSPKFAWVKMEYAQLVTLSEEEKVRKRIAKALQAPDGYEQLGRIVAVDMFTWNNDRFAFYNGLKETQGKKWNGKEMNHLLNPGNIILKRVGESWEFVGLDAFDPSSPNTGLRPLQTGKTWPFVIFTEGAIKNGWVDLIAERCVADLKWVANHEGLSKYKVTKKVGAPRFAKGLMQGAKMIEESFKGKYLNNPHMPVPQGLIERALKAEWKWFNNRTNMQTAFGNLKRASHLPHGQRN